MTDPKYRTKIPRYRPRLRFHKPGVAPGTLKSAPADTALSPAAAQISLIRYNVADIQEQDIGELDEIGPPFGENQINWLHFQGMPTSEQMEHLRDRYELHPLALEDVLNGERRPKSVSYESHYFVILSHLRSDHGELYVEPVAFFLGKNFVISIDRGAHNVLEPIRRRLLKKRTLLARGADYLFYALMDTVIDMGFPLLESLGERLEALEDEILDNPDRESRNEIHRVKRELVTLRRTWWPQREVVSSLIRDSEQLIHDNTRIYMRDCYDHCVIMLDFVETYRDIASNLLDIYLSAVSQRMNDIMKALTIIATIFLPLTFLSGLYGMNFDTKSPWNMPELAWHFGYFYALGVMVAIALVMLFWFRRKRWL
jgi:magnesium transporter